MRLFAKYEGTGNDFVIFDDPDSSFPIDQQLIHQLCNRRLGIGADGLILVRPSDTADYEMVYFNADGRVGSMCGNGARCAFDFVRLSTMKLAMSFAAYDGMHRGKVLPNGWISVSMQDVSSHRMIDGDCVLDTGSPHYVRFVDNLAAIDVFAEGKAIRMQDPHREKGINVNFVEVRDGSLHVSTFERGVEDVTLSCGTGAVATALTYALKNDLTAGPVDILTAGGPLKVGFEYHDGTFRHVTLQGPVRRVFEGSVDSEE